jgi:hypothetical protein
MSEWIDRLVKDRYKTYGALATRIGMTDSGFSRAAKAGTFDVENCLKLAHETGESAETVLEMAGKRQVHELIERLYGKVHRPKDADAVKAGELFSKLKIAEGREGVLLILEGLVKQEKRRATTTPP